MVLRLFDICRIMPQSSIQKLFLSSWTQDRFVVIFITQCKHFLDILFFSVEVKFTEHIIILNCTFWWHFSTSTVLYTYPLYLVLEYFHYHIVEPHPFGSHSLFSFLPVPGNQQSALLPWVCSGYFMQMESHNCARCPNCNLCVWFSLFNITFLKSIHVIRSIFLQLWT